MEAVKNWRATVRNSRRRGAWNVRKVMAELGRPSPSGVAEQHRSVASYNGEEPGSGRPAGTASEAAVVLIDPDGQHNRRGGKGRCFVHASGDKEWP